MNAMKKNRCALAWALCGLLASSCGEVEEPTPTYMLSGTITSTTVGASNAWAFVRLVTPDGLLEDTPLYKASCQLSGPSCEYQINQVAAGRYTVYALIDLDDNAERTNPLPSFGDLLSPGRPLFMLGRQWMDFPDESWRFSP